jgi:hypothetical protein
MMDDALMLPVETSGKAINRTDHADDNDEEYGFVCGVFHNAIHNRENNREDKEQSKQKMLEPTAQQVDRVRQMSISHLP